MIKNNLLNSIHLLTDYSEENKILIFYRYLSLIVASAVYLVGSPEHSLMRKFIIILCLSISSIIITYIYIKKEDDKNSLKLILIIETIGNSLILIPSGGLNSPYLWYVLNTILVAALKLKKRYCYINLIVYVFSATALFYLTIEKNGLTFFQLLYGELNSILSLLLITMAIHVLATTMDKVEIKNQETIKINDELKRANKKIKETTDHKISLYSTVHNLTNYKDKERLIKLMLQYLVNISQIKEIFYFNKLENREIIIGLNSVTDDIKEKYGAEVFLKWNKILVKDAPVIINSENKRYILTPIKSGCRNYGIVGIKIKNTSDYILNNNELIDHLTFISGLVALVFERIDLEESNKRLSINQEQNRIANEIHDSILQRLFSTTCGIYGLIKNIEKIERKEVISELNLIRESINNTMKDLRSTIYRLSWKKDGINAFEVNILSYINELRKLNNIDISFELIGNHEFLSSDRKHGIYRIICEGVGNSIRHGKASEIQITLNITNDLSTLEITDNGRGFNTKEVKTESESGIGLKNIELLASSFKGHFQILSKPKNGTILKILIPNENRILHKEGVV